MRADALFCRSSSSGGTSFFFLGATVFFFLGDTVFWPDTAPSTCLRARSSARSSALMSSVTASGPRDITGGGITGEAGRAGCSRSAAVDVGCSARERLRSATTSRASSFTAPVSRASDRAFCCLSSQSLACAKETGSSAGGPVSESRGRFLSALHRSLYYCRRL